MLSQDAISTIMLQTMPLQHLSASLNFAQCQQSRKGSIWNNGGNLRENPIEECGGDLFVSEVSMWLEDRCGGARERILVEVKAHDLRKDGKNDEDDISEVDSEGFRRRKTSIRLRLKRRRED